MFTWWWFWAQVLLCSAISLSPNGLISVALLLKMLYARQKLSVSGLNLDQLFFMYQGSDDFLKCYVLQHVKWKKGIRPQGAVGYKVQPGFLLSLPKSLFPLKYNLEGRLIAQLAGGFDSSHIKGFSWLYVVMESISLGCMFHLCSNGSEQIGESVKTDKKLRKEHVLCLPNVILSLFLREWN